jgi:hypothetical protein
MCGYAAAYVHPFCMLSCVERHVECLFYRVKFSLHFNPSSVLSDVHATRNLDFSGFGHEELHKTRKLTTVQSYIKSKDTQNITLPPGQDGPSTKRRKSQTRGTRPAGLPVLRHDMSVENTSSKYIGRWNPGAGRQL